MFSTLFRYGALEVEEASPILIHLDCEAKSINVKDVGSGMNSHQLSRLFDAFYTTHKSFQDNPTYQYSRDFGVPFSGAGFGMLKSKVYLDFHEASIDVQSNLGLGTEINITFL